MRYLILASGIRATRIVECKLGHDEDCVRRDEYYIDTAETLEEAKGRLAEHKHKDGTARIKRTVGFIYRWIFMMGVGIALYFYSDIDKTVTTPLAELTILRMLGALMYAILAMLLGLWAFHRGHKNYELWFHLGNWTVCLTLLAWYFFIVR